MRQFIPAACLIAVLTLPWVAISGGTDPAHGRWLTENRKAIVEFAPCGSATCGHMVWVRTPRDDAGNLKLGANGQPLCGLRLVGDLHAVRPGVWEGGWIYNPKKGTTYSVEIEALSPGELKVRGYLGLWILGQSQIWTRIEEDPGGCG